MANLRVGWRKVSHSDKSHGITITCDLYWEQMLCERLAGKKAGKTGILLKNTHYNYKPKNMNSAYLLLFRNFPGVVL